MKEGVYLFMLRQKGNSIIFYACDHDLKLVELRKMYSLNGTSCSSRQLLQ